MAAQNAVDALRHVVTVGLKHRWWSTPHHSKLSSVIIRVAKLAVCAAVLSTLLTKDSRQWSLLWIGGTLGYFTHPKPGSKADEDTVWRRVKLFWDVGPFVGLVVAYPFFFDKMSFASVFVVGLIVGGELYVWLETRKGHQGPKGH